MKIWLYRWEDGKASVVVAKNKHDAWSLLDEEGPCDESRLVPLGKGFQITFRVDIDSGDGDMEVPLLEACHATLEFEDSIFEYCYPWMNAEWKLNGPEGKIQKAYLADVADARKLGQVDKGGVQ